MKHRRKADEGAMVAEDETVRCPGEKYNNVWGGNIGLERIKKELESIQERYITWSLKLDKHTPEYLIQTETNSENIEVKAGTRPMKHEEKLRIWRLDTL